MNNKNRQKDQKPAIPFSIYQVSSEDVEYPSSELLRPSNTSKGWQTQRFAQFPQHIIVKFPRKCQLQSLQYLSHQCKISSKVEIYISIANPNKDEPTFKKLGYFTLSNNEALNYQSRELKTVYIEAPVQFIKFIFHHPFANIMNFFNQVGVIGLTFLGTEITGEAIPLSNPHQNDRNRPISDNIQVRGPVDQNIYTVLKQYEREKEIAVQQEDYSLAKELKLKIDRLKDSLESVSRLEQQKKIALENEDYDAAAVIKQEIDRITGGQNSHNAKPKSGPGVQFEDNNLHDSRHQLKRRQDHSQDSKEEHDNDQNRYIDVQSGRKGQNPPFKTNPQNQIQQEVIKPISRTKENFVQHSDPKTFDDMPIPTANNNNNKNQKQQMDEYPTDQNDYSNTGEVPKKHAQTVDYLSTYFDRTYLCEAFGVSIQSRMAASEKLMNEVDTFNPGKMKVNSEILVTNDLSECVFASWKLVLYFLEERAAQMFQNASTTIDLLMEISRTKNILSYLRSKDDFLSLIDNLVEVILDKIGEFKNPNIMDWSTNTLLNLNTYGFLGYEDSIEKLIGKKASKSKLQTSIKHITGKLILLQNFVKEFGSELKLGHQKLVKYSIDNLENSNKAVRDESNNLIVEIFRIIGEERILKLLESSKIRKNHLETLRQRFEEDFEENEHEVIDPRKNEIETKNVGVKKHDQRSIEEENEDDHEEDEDFNEGVNECHFCRLNHENFSNPDFMDLHLYKSCLMLMSCNECQQVIEVRELNNHLLNECKNMSMFSQCQRCLKAIPNAQFQAHKTKLTCKLQRPDQKSPRCPLCLNDLILKKNDGDETLREHLVSGECANHPRNN